MAVTSEVWSGLRLAPLPKPADQFRGDRIPQAVVIELPKERVDKLLKTPQAGDVVEARAKLSDYGPSIEFTTTSSDGKSTRDELSSKAVEKLLRLTENGYIYLAGETSGSASLRSRLDLKKLPSKKLDEGEDAGLLALQRGLHNAKAEKQSHRTTLAEVRPSSKRQGASLVASLTGGSKNPKAHRVGLFGVNKQPPRSLNSSPSLAPQILGASTRPGKDSKKTAAKKRAIVHLLAVRPVSASYIAKTIKASLKDIEPILGRIASPYRLDASKYELNDLAYKLLDPYGFENYPEDDRSRAIERAIEAFDRKRFASDNKAWQMLLSKDERNKGKCPSRLAKKLLSTDLQTQAPRSLEAARTTPVPEINVSEAGSPPRASNSKPSEASDSMRKRSSSDAVNDSSQERASKRTKQGADPHSKVLSAMFNQTQKEKERAKERAKAEKEAHTLAKKRDARPTGSTQPSTKAASSKTVASSRPAPVAASTPASGKFKSAEMVSKSDDEEAEAEVQKGKEMQAAKSGKSAVRSTTKTVAKATTAAVASAMGTKTGTKVAGETAEKAARKPVASAAATPATSVAQKPAKTSSAWDFSKKTAPNASSSNSALSSASTAGRARASSSAKPAGGSRPPTPSSLGIHRRQVSDTRKTGVTSTTAKHGAQPPTQRLSAGGNVAQATAPGRTAAKPVEKPASARTDLIRKLDSAKRKPGMDVKAGRPAGSMTGASADREKPSSSTGNVRNERAGPSTSSVGGKLANTGAPARASETASAPPMSRTFSHQRKSSSPLKPSPLAASPPINLSDIDDAARQNRTSAAKTLPKKPLPSTTDVRGAAQPIKRKADELDSKRLQTGSTALASSGLERPAKRRETGTAAPISTGAAGSRPAAAAHPGDAGLSKPRRRSQEDGNRSHSPSPASSTIGSTSTKGTTMSLLSSAGKDKSVAASKPATMQVASAGKSEVLFKGIKTSELERMHRFEEQREQYNRKQREVAAMENPPIEKVRELNKLFHSLETQKKVLAALEHSN